MPAVSIAHESTYGLLPRPGAMRPPFYGVNPSSGKGNRKSDAPLARKRLRVDAVASFIAPVPGGIIVDSDEQGIPEER